MQGSVYPPIHDYFKKKKETKQKTTTTTTKTVAMTTVKYSIKYRQTRNGSMILWVELISCLTYWF